MMRNVLILWMFVLLISTFGVLPITGQFNLLDLFKNVPIEEDVKFWCVNRNNPNYTRVLVNDTSLHAKLDLSKPFTLFTHGYFDHIQKPWIRELLTEYITHHDVNVCAIGWGRLAAFDYITSANIHTRMVANYATVFLRYLLKEGLPMEKITLTGFSLGAHISGFIGANFKGELPQIYGLDPAGPLFSVPILVDTACRLDPSDAKRVQVIHTSAYTFGTAVDSGHQDFIANNGALQPGCLLGPANCNHHRAIDYFKSALNPANKFIATQCIDHPTYEKNVCKDNPTAKLGVFSNNVPGKYFFNTGSEKPYTIV